MPSGAARRGPRRVSDIRIGTSGWHYDSWWGPFFPPKLRKKDALRCYASHFAATELNAPFYRTPTEEAVKGWYAQTPDGFLFAWKASRFITHWKRLSEKSENSLELMESRLKLLHHKVGPVLFQLPPHFAPNRDRLASFLEMLPRRRRYVFEFRHPDWYDEAIYATLRDRNVVLFLRQRPEERRAARRAAPCRLRRGQARRHLREPC